MFFGTLAIQMLCLSYLNVATRLRRMVVPFNRFIPSPTFTLRPMATTATFNSFTVKEEMLQCLLQENILKEECPVVMVYNFTYLNDHIKCLHDAFPDNFTHSFAAKANQIVSVLREIKENGMACEVASIGEYELALRAGFAPEKVVFDSPAKTRAEIARALKAGSMLNIDNWQEFERVRQMVECGDVHEASVIGIRVNPQLGAGSLEAFSTATNTSKFGVAVGDKNADSVVEKLLQSPWIRALHCHVGSQGCPLSLMVSGAKSLVHLAKAINAKNPGQITTLDIGGGLPVNFDDDFDNPTFWEYSKQLRENVPELFSGEFKVVTEFGRSVIQKAGVTVCRVEYTKQMGGRHIAIIQAGADLFLRTVYMPDKWPLRASIFNSSGQQKTDQEVLTDIAGPCCFSGDLVVRERSLPLTEPGDIVMMHDTGGYYYASFSHYNARQAPPVFSYDVKLKSFQTLQAAETVDDTVQFFCRLPAASTK